MSRSRWWAAAVLWAPAACGVAESGGGCPSPYTECDGDPGTVCETDPLTSVDHCGACGAACPSGPNQRPVCTAGACGVVCTDGFADCDHEPANGCETPIGSCGVTTLVADVAFPMGLAVDDTYVYFGSKGTPPDYLDRGVFRVAKQATGKDGMAVPLTANVYSPLNLAIDDTTVFIADNGHAGTPDGRMLAVPKVGGPTNPIATGMTGPNNPLVIGDRLFWTTVEPPGGHIVSAPKDGGVVTPVANTVPWPTGLRLAATNTLVWAARGVAMDGKDAAVEFLDLGNMKKHTLVNGIALPSYKIGVTAGAAFVGSFLDGRIHRVPLDGSAPTVIATVGGEPYEIHADGERLFVSTSFGQEMVAIPAAGGATTVVAEGQILPSYVALDAEDVYWIDGFSKPHGAIRKAKKPAP